MPKYIDADLLRTVVIACSDKQGRFTVDDILMMIDAVKPADVEEVKHGEWIQDTRPHRGLRFVCNKCKIALATLRVGVDSVSYTVGDNIANYCPNCGAKMDGKENNNAEIH